METNFSKLNEKQLEAVKSESKRLLVLAGAGSGKTKTLLEKLIYLMREKRVQPTNILVVTFTKNATNEMIDRLVFASKNGEEYKQFMNNPKKGEAEKNKYREDFKRANSWLSNLSISTFHSFCHNLLRKYGVSEFDNKFRVIKDTKNSKEEADFTYENSQETDFEIAHRILIQLSKKREYLLDLKRYILDYFVDKNNRPLENKETSFYENQKSYVSLNGTKVRSKSERYIADWLYRHNIDFSYEAPLNCQDFYFHPDFYIPQADIYLEHISDMSVGVKEKEKQYKKANKTLFKTYENIHAKDSVLFNEALDAIVKNRLPASYKSQTALSFEEELNSYHKELKDFIIQALRIIKMIKAENLSTSKALKKALADPHQRVRDFYRLVIPLMKKYQAYCVNKSYLDFEDMIVKTIDLFKHRAEIKEKFQQQYKYILVDEFQDVNNLQVDLLKRLLTPENQLFCVGDDWQSIYGFRGSNVNYIVNFGKYFPKAEVIKLNQNYRSTEHIVGASNEVIKHNKFKVDKEIFANKKSDTKVNIFAGNDQQENIDFVVEEVKRLFQKGYQKEDILFLYRRSKMYNDYYNRFMKERIYVQYRTIHAAKGLEAKAVFIIGLTQGYGGFPDVWLEDRIFQVVKPTQHDLLMEEERRLFYVAITRAKDLLYLITEKGNESSFLSEIPENFVIKSMN
ncbi:ATP-dependent helicase [Capnocytophaga gingivalis]|jgi:probable DNA helicase II homolog|uniref:DNA 3'-5' helicase n=1 Tax=Capnocytophaga gingivalis TaxID=1017 RepID=A0ABU5Y7G5_9FLAO|nr:ATP-dependent helicase [Capnocytophaga gingivalis]MEB3039868.1 ATP-dependent helicase [Capnocytophaga gingivalis]RKW17221.1 MAG: ATP-dependent helicase [Capnocytophaga sp.]